MTAPAIAEATAARARVGRPVPRRRGLSALARLRHTVGSWVIARTGDPVSLEGGVQRFIGVVLGAVATFLVLLVTSTSIVADQNKGYLIAVVVGAIVAWLWPWVIGMILVRRHRTREQARVHDQVAKEMADQSK
jgi:hypothetical protein